MHEWKREIERKSEKERGLKLGTCNTLGSPAFGLAQTSKLGLNLFSHRRLSAASCWCACLCQSSFCAFLFLSSPSLTDLPTLLFYMKRQYNIKVNVLCECWRFFYSFFLFFTVLLISNASIDDVTRLVNIFIGKFDCATSRYSAWKVCS